MMLHRHFEEEKRKKQVQPSVKSEVDDKNEQFVSDVFPPDKEAEPKRTRRKKEAE